MQIWASKRADGKIKLDYNPHETGTNSKGERVTVTDQITDKKTDLSKENIFTADKDGNIVQINKAPQAETKVTSDNQKPTESGSVGVGGDVPALKDSKGDITYYSGRQSDNNDINRMGGKYNGVYFTT